MLAAAARAHDSHKQVCACACRVRVRERETERHAVSDHSGMRVLLALLEKRGLDASSHVKSRNTMHSNVRSTNRCTVVWIPSVTSIVHGKEWNTPKKKTNCQRLPCLLLLSRPNDTKTQAIQRACFRLAAPLRVSLAPKPSKSKPATRGYLTTTNRTEAAFSAAPSFILPTQTPRHPHTQDAPF